MCFLISSGINIKMTNIYDPIIWVSCLIQLSQVLTVENTETTGHIKIIFDLFGVKDTNYFSTIYIID